MSAKAGKLVTVGRVRGAHGVKGWLKIQSYTEPLDKLADYHGWVLRRGDHEQAVTVEQFRAQAGSLLAKLQGVEDRDAAVAWTGAEIAVARSQLSPCEPGDYYWTDLEGLEVRTIDGELLGTVDHLLATGSNDVLVLSGARDRLVPFVMGAVVRSVDLDAGVIVADWPLEA